MRIVVADSAGFCMGVRRAVDMALELMDQTREPVCSIGPLIHNPQVVELLKKRGVKPAPSQDEIDNGIVIIRSHGISPALREKLEERGLKILDATCPKVARVHHAVGKYAGLGYLVVVLGDPGHSEVEGILGFADNKAVVIRSGEEVKRLPDAERVILVAQTTQSSARFEEVASAVRERYSSLAEDRLVIINTICDSTERKQEEVRELARKVDAFVVVGGKESANTRRLKEIAESEGKPAYLVESEDELDLDKIRGLAAVGLTAGASTPNWMIQRVYDRLISAGASGLKFPLRSLHQFLGWLKNSSLVLGVGAGLIAVLGVFAYAGGPGGSGSGYTTIILLAIAILLMMEARRIDQDLQQFQADRMVGRKTVPARLGMKAGQWLLHVLLGLAAVLAIAEFHYSRQISIAMLTGIVWLWISVSIFSRAGIVRKPYAKFMVDFSFVITGGIGLLLWWL